MTALRDPRSLELAASYDRIADEYAARIYDELRHKPLDRELLDRFAQRVRDAGRACDLGCGPGQVARYLHERGVETCGIDLSLGMARRAARLNPGIAFHVADMRALPVPDERWAGIAAFYCLLHIDRPQMVDTLRELRRTLRPGGLLLAAFHIGDQTLHPDEMWGQPVSIDFHFFQPAEMTAWMQAAGFAVDEVLERDPYPDVEHPSRRAYLSAHRPAAAAGSRS